MAVHLIVQGAQQIEKPFPKLMVNHKNEIFYMVREGYGLPLTGSNWVYDIEDFANFSGMDFTDYNEPITIRNV